MQYVIVEFSVDITVNQPGTWREAIEAYEAVLRAISIETYMTNDGKQTDPYNVTWAAMVTTKSEEQAGYVAKMLCDLADLLDAATTKTYFGIEPRTVVAETLAVVGAKHV